MEKPKVIEIVEFDGCLLECACGSKLTFKAGREVLKDILLLLKENNIRLWCLDKEPNDATKDLILYTDDEYIAESRKEWIEENTCPPCQEKMKDPALN